LFLPLSFLSFSEVGGQLSTVGEYLTTEPHPPNLVTRKFTITQPLFNLT
jgi:hypothetical protein